MDTDTLTTMFDFGVMGERDVEVTYTYEDECDDSGYLVRTVGKVTKVELVSNVHGKPNLDLTDWADFTSEVQLDVDEELAGVMYSDHYSKEPEYGEVA